MTGKSIFGILLILLGAAVGFFGAYPMWLDIADMQAERGSLTETKKRMEKLAEKRDEISAKYNSISPADLAKLEEFFPRQADSDILLINMDKLASENGMILKNISMAEGKDEVVKQKESTVENFPFDISISGSYSSFQAFLKALEKSRRLIEIERLTFDSGKAAGREFYEFTVDAYTFWRK